MEKVAVAVDKLAIGKVLAARLAHEALLMDKAVLVGDAVGLCVKKTKAGEWWGRNAGTDGTTQGGGTAETGPCIGSAFF